MQGDVQYWCDLFHTSRDKWLSWRLILQVMYHPTAGHGGFLLSHSWRRQVLANIKVVVATGADLAAKSAKVQ